jgi:PQQ-dependent dehydrogenase (methanol/ethanol family)
MLSLCLIMGSTRTLAQQPPDWHKDPSRAGEVGIDTDLSKEQPTLALPPAGGDTDWPYYNNRMDGDRYLPLEEINSGNVAGLTEACRVHVSGAGPFSAGTILVNGVIYTTAWRSTLALQPTTCDVVWKALYEPEQSEVYNANRGVAYWKGKLFRGAGDDRMLAYDAATGRELWRTQIGDPSTGEYLAAAPLAWNGKVLMGTAGGDLGVPGRMLALDADTGKLLWSFDTVQHPDSRGGTWPGSTWKTGGGSTWSAYTLDAQTGELFVTVSNPAPALDAKVRMGDNLYSDSVLDLDAATGKLLWHYQIRKNDNHDYDVSAPAVLLTIDDRKVIAVGSKDGFLYLIDRGNHRLLWKTPVTTILNVDADPTPAGVKVCPGAKGGVEYNSPVYDPTEHLLVVGAVDWCYNLFKTPYPPYAPGSPYIGGKMLPASEAGTGWITAVDARTGRVRWRYPTLAPVIAGITATRGGVTFAGDTSGLLYVLRTKDGALLRKIDTGGAMAGGIIGYQSHGHQYLAVNSGNVSRSSWGSAAGTPTLIVYRLPQSAAAEQDPAALAPRAESGAAVFEANCTVCHGAAGRGGEGAKLAGIASTATQSEIVRRIVDPRPGMPKLYPGALSAQDVADVAAYVRSLPP